jgi:hypothetical protein
MYDPYAYEITTSDELSIVTLVKTWLSCLISITIALSRPSVELAVEAEQPVNVTLPKSAKATSDPPLSKSSTIHSAFWPPRSEEELGALSDLDTVSPVDSLFIVTFPLLRELAWMVTVMTSPADREIPEKSYA